MGHIVVPGGVASDLSQQQRHLDDDGWDTL
jgi:hypothetical protein